MTDEFYIPCQHLTDGYSWEMSHVDYHPLTLVEIADFLEIAQTVSWVVRNSLQMRLCQGVIGVICPNKLGTAVSHQRNLIDRLLMTYGHLGAEPWLVQKLYDVMMFQCTEL